MQVLTSFISTFTFAKSIIIYLIKKGQQPMACMTHLNAKQFPMARRSSTFYKSILL